MSALERRAAPVAGERVRAVRAASVPRIAIPSAPASCIETLMIPEAEPGVGSGHAAHRDRQQRQHRRAHAEAHQREGDEQLREVARARAGAR